jgi:hypothetical protein
MTGFNRRPPELPMEIRPRLQALKWVIRPAFPVTTSLVLLRGLAYSEIQLTACAGESCGSTIHCSHPLQPDGRRRAVKAGESLRATRRTCGWRWSSKGRFRQHASEWIVDDRPASAGIAGRNVDALTTERYRLLPNAHSPASAAKSTSRTNVLKICGEKRRKEWRRSGKEPGGVVHLLAGGER